MADKDTVVLATLEPTAETSPQAQLAALRCGSAAEEAAARAIDGVLQRYAVLQIYAGYGVPPREEKKNA